LGCFTSIDSTVIFVGTIGTQNLTPGGQAFGNVTINSGLIGYWKFDEATSPATDWSGYANYGTWSGDVSRSIGTSTKIKYNNPGSAQFDGADDYIDFGDINAVDNAIELTVR